MPFRLGMNPQATWLRRINPAFKQLGALVIKYIRLVSKSALKAPFMGRSFVALAFMPVAMATYLFAVDS